MHHRQSGRDATRATASHHVGRHKLYMTTTTLSLSLSVTRPTAAVVRDDRVQTQFTYNS